MNTLAKRTSLGFPRLDNFFGDDVFWDDIFERVVRSDQRNRSIPRSGVVTTEEGVRIEIEAPGMKRDDFRVDVDNDRLTVAAHVEKRDESEFYKRSFERSWTLQQGTIYDRISASYTDGILRIDVPTKAPPTHRKLSIDVK